MNSVVAKIYDHNKDLWGYPQEYKGIKIYPIKLKDLKYQNLFYTIFMQPKNYIPEKEIIKMAYLKFLLYYISSSMGIEIKKMNEDLVDFLQYITKCDNISFWVKELPNKNSFTIAWNIDDANFTENDFDNIREIVLEQNGFSIEYVEGYIQDLEESLAFMNRYATERTLQDDVFTLCALANKSVIDFEDYTLHQFKHHLERMMLLEDYRLYNPLVVSGQVTLKHGKIEHYFKHIPKAGRYDSLIFSKDKFDDQFKNPKADVNNKKE